MNPKAAPIRLTRMQRYRKAKSMGRVRLITEGDSWFNYPAHGGIPGHERDITEFLAGRHRYAVLGFEKFGAELSDMVAQMEFLPYLKKEKPRAVLFSGGGNDILGPPLKDLVLDRGSGKLEESIDWDYLNGGVLPQVEKGYETLLQMIDLQRPGTPLITHGYAYAIPSNRPARVFWVKVAGPWIKPTLVEKGIVKAAEQRQIVVFLIDALNECQQRMAAKHPGRFIHVDLRELVTGSDWTDEIHLTPRGYRKAAAAIHNAIKALS